MKVIKEAGCDKEFVVKKLQCQMMRHNPANTNHLYEHEREAGYCAAMNDAIKILNGENIKDNHSMIGYSLGRSQ